MLAVGAVSNDFGTPGARKHCIFLDDREQADRFREKLLNHCLRVSRAMSANAAADAKVEIVIVGGGATGVELAAELYNAAAGLRHYGLEVFDESRLKVTLVEAGPRILPALPEKLAKAAHEELEALGVRVLTGTAITEVTAEAMVTKGGEVIPADLKVWAAGVRAPDFLQGHRRAGDDALQPARRAADAADDPRRPHLRHRRLLLLQARGRGAAGSAARPGGAPDGVDGLPQHSGPHHQPAAGALRLPRQGLAGVAEPLLDRWAA